MRGAHPTLRFSHIVRPRAHDMSPIVDEDDQNEFVDEQLEHPEYTGWLKVVEWFETSLLAREQGWLLGVRVSVAVC